MKTQPQEDIEDMFDTNSLIIEIGIEGIIIEGGIIMIEKGGDSIKEAVAEKKDMMDVEGKDMIGIEVEMIEMLLEGRGVRVLNQFPSLRNQGGNLMNLKMRRFPRNKRTM